MKILITGAFGNLGTQILNLLKNTEHEVRCFSTKSRRAKKVARKYKQRFEIFYGDLFLDSRLLYISSLKSVFVFNI